jgi:hypothetical protein
MRIQKEMVQVMVQSAAELASDTSEDDRNIATPLPKSESKEQHVLFAPMLSPCYLIRLGDGQQQVKKGKRTGKFELKSEER